MLTSQKKKATKKRAEGVSVSQVSRTMLSGWSIPYIYNSSRETHHEEEEKRRKQNAECVCAQIGTSQTNPCNPEQGRTAKAADVK
jgi:hypothetical protein